VVVVFAEGGAAAPPAVFVVVGWVVGVAAVDVVGVDAVGVVAVAVGVVAVVAGVVGVVVVGGSVLAGSVVVVTCWASPETATNAPATPPRPSRKIAVTTMIGQRQRPGGTTRVVAA
jgi:hypothetical protein